MAALLILSACASGPFQSGLDDEAKLRLEAMDASLELKDVSITSLEERVTALEDENFQIGKEINMMRDNIAKLETQPMATSASQPTNMATYTGAIGVHLASYRNMETTTAGWHTFVEKYGEHFNGVRGIVSIFTSQAGESFFRLKAGPFASKEDAHNFCTTLEALDDYCNVDSFEGSEIN